MSDICHLCWGQQFFFVRQDNKNHWHSCPHCNGVGTVRCHAPPTIKIHWRKNKKAAKANEAFDKEWNFPAKNNPKFLPERS